jgi:hypothetical protein
MNALQGKKASHEQQHGQASGKIQRRDHVDMAKREQRVIAGDA